MMLSVSCATAHAAQRHLIDKMIQCVVPTQRTSWQSSTAPSPARELASVVLSFTVPDSLTQWQDRCQPDLPWAEDHFGERVSGRPLNPPPSYVNWPWHSQSEAQKFVREGGKFDHTYPERYWPTRDYGDLDDVAKLLKTDPWTRQAYLPVWFPEDTGAVNGQRVPCSLGYHFIRNGPSLDCNYFIRSCDITRHFKNDIYLTGRLLQWMVEQVYQRGHTTPYPGTLTTFISNLHLFTQDEWRFK